MSAAFREGDQVTILGPYHDDPVVIEHQHFGIVAEVVHGDGEPTYRVKLESTYPPNRLFGPFPQSRLTRGWRSR